jgi:hypothetical protein
MSDPLVTVMQHAKIMGWPLEDASSRYRAEDKAYVLTLSNALSRTYRTDAHFTQYSSPNGRRLKIAATGQVTVYIHVIVFDVDCPEVHGQPEPAPVSWRCEAREKVLALRAAHPGLYFYETRGGMRLIYRQPIPFEVACHEDVMQWKQDYAVTAAYFKRCFDLDVDLACSDWTRLFRLPRATRKPGGAPESYPTAGDENNIGSIWFVPEEEDHALAKQLLPNAYQTKRIVDYSPTMADGYGVFYHLLRARGLIIREFGRAAFVIRCPNEAQHSCGVTGDRSTVLYLPHSGHTLGRIWCLHGHCSGLRAQDWMRFFDQHEIDQAKDAAGVPRYRKGA